MKSYLFAIICLLFASNSYANTLIDVNCQKSVIDAAMNVTEVDLPLEYSIEGIVKTDLSNVYVQVIGMFLDAEEDYSYTEIYEVEVAKNSCNVVNAKIVDTIEN